MQKSSVATKETKMGPTSAAFNCPLATEQMKHKWLSAPSGCTRRWAAWLTESRPEKNSRTASKLANAEFAIRFALTDLARSCKRGQSSMMRSRAQLRTFMFALLHFDGNVDQFFVFLEQFFVSGRGF